MCFTCWRKRLIELCEPDFLSSDLKRDLPGGLPAAMFARQFIDPAFKRLSKTEIVAMERQHLLAANGIENPIR